MKQFEAFCATVELAKNRKMKGNNSLSLEHLEDMKSRITSEFSEGKLGRWLGWAQATLVANGVANLEEMKNLNKSFSD